MIPKIKDLAKRMEYGVHNNELYFDVEQLREKYPNLRFPPDKIVQVFIKSVLRNGIRQQDIQELSDFDKKMMKLYNIRK